MTCEGGAKDTGGFRIRVLVVFGQNTYDSLPSRHVSRSIFAHGRTVSEPTRLASIRASASLRLIRTRRPNFTNGILRWHTHARIVLGFSRSKAAASGTVRSSLFISHRTIS